MIFLGGEFRGPGFKAKPPPSGTSPRGVWTKNAGLVKIGFSTKDPSLRAEELSHTDAAKDGVLLETYHRVNRQVVEARRSAEIAADKVRNEHDQLLRNIERQLDAKENELHEHYKRLRESAKRPLGRGSFVFVWLLASFFLAILAAGLFPKAGDMVQLVTGVISGALVAAGLLNFLNGRAERSNFDRINQEANEAIRRVRKPIVSCPHCRKSVQLDQAKAMLEDVWTCPSCKGKARAPRL